MKRQSHATVFLPPTSCNVNFRREHIEGCTSIINNIGKINKWRRRTQFFAIVGFKKNFTAWMQ